MRQQVIHGTAAWTLLLMAAAPLAAGNAWDAAEMDWPHWRGPEMNGISRETGLIDEWSPRGKNVIWKNDELATRSTPIVMNGKLYVLTRANPETKREGERVVCADASTGEILWQNEFNAFLTDVPDTRVAWSSVAGDPETGNVFALGVCGLFQAIDGETGETLWSHSMSEEYGMLTTYGGRTNVPLVHGNLVIISGVIIGWGEMAKPTHRFVAFDKRNGQAVWFNGTRVLPYDTTYSTPVLAVVNGQLLMVFGSGDGGIHAFQPETGKTVWSYDVSTRGINTTPLVVGNTVIAGHSEENVGDTAMGALFAIDATQSGDITESGEIWRHKEWFVGKSSPIHVDGRIYACEDTGTLLIVELESGELIASQKLGGPMRSSPIYADGKIYLCTENGRFWIFRPSEGGVETVFRSRLSREASHGSPIVSHGRIYLPTSSTMYCLGSSDTAPATDPRPEPPALTPVAEDQAPAHLQVVPVESLLRPGLKQRFDARVYNANGQFLRMARGVEFSVEGPGSIDSDGLYSTLEGATESAAVYVTAKADGLTGSARIRVVPEFPWSVDFSNGEVPITWVGCRYRHIVIDFDLLKSLESQNPLAAQLYIYLMTEFINGGKPNLTFDDSTPRRQWTNLLLFLNLQEDPAVLKTVDGARAALDPLLELLKGEQVVQAWEFSDWAARGQEGVRLTVERGSRGIDGNGVMTKIKTIPKGARSQGWMGHTDLHDYTIQADVMGTIKDGKMPDIGLTGQRYVLNLLGASQMLRIQTWHAQFRMAQSVPFEWTPNVWYTMKLRASVEDGKAVLRGKVWPRDEPEPESWTLEATDESPNVVGSPGLFGNAKDAEVFYDNFKMTYN